MFPPAHRSWRPGLRIRHTLVYCTRDLARATALSTSKAQRTSRHTLQLIGTTACEAVEGCWIVHTARSTLRGRRTVAASGPHVRAHQLTRVIDPAVTATSSYSCVAGDSGCVIQAGVQRPSHGMPSQLQTALQSPPVISRHDASAHLRGYPLLAAFSVACCACNDAASEAGDVLQQECLSERPTAVCATGSLPPRTASGRMHFVPSLLIAKIAAGLSRILGSAASVRIKRCFTKCALPSAPYL